MISSLIDKSYQTQEGLHRNAAQNLNIFLETTNSSLGATLSADL